MLFSEPKIPQSPLLPRGATGTTCFSALQRAENSSISSYTPYAETAPGFQCSSASRKFLNADRHCHRRFGFPFQCSSASRKFLNPVTPPPNGDDVSCFSALQRAENSSIDQYRVGAVCRRRFQCSSASRKFLNRNFRTDGALPCVFQCSSASRKFLNSPGAGAGRRAGVCFSALQRAENSSILRRCRRSGLAANVSVLFSEPKIPQSRWEVSGDVAA